MVTSLISRVSLDVIKPAAFILICILLATNFSEKAIYGFMGSVFLLNCLFVIWLLKRLKALELILEEKEKSLNEALFYRDEFLTIASHELKTPLTSLKLQCQIFKRAVSKNEKDAYDIGRIDRLVHQTDSQVSRMVKLIDDMLDLSRIRTGMLSITRERFDLGELVKSVVHEMRPEIPIEQSYEECPVMVDKARIEQVLKVLLNNAVKYGRGLPVTIQVVQQDGVAVAMLKDKGMGIAKQLHEKIFERFERAVPASEVSGLGLGLYIAKKIITAHAGKISLESEIDKGSTFTLVLPLVER